MPDGAVRRWQGQAAIWVLWPAGLLASPTLAALAELPVCGFRYFTGLPCPLCGGTRACAALVQGDLAAAWQLNPGAVLVIAVGTAHVAALMIEARGRRPLTARVMAGAWACAAAGLLTGWGLRLAHI